MILQLLYLLEIGRDLTTMDQTESWKRTNVTTTRFSEIASTLRASLYKQSERNLLKNITDGVGYEGIIECWERKNA